MEGAELELPGSDRDYRLGDEADGAALGTRLEPEVEDLLSALSLDGVPIVAAGWLDGLRDFELRAADGRGLRFLDCLQVSYVRPPADDTPALGSWWTDEPSPVLLSLGPQVRFLFTHLVIEIGEGLLRAACRSIVPLR